MTTYEAGRTCLPPSGIMPIINDGDKTCPRSTRVPAHTAESADQAEPAAPCGRGPTHARSYIQM